MTTRLAVALVGLCLVMGMTASTLYAGVFTDGIQSAQNTANDAGLSTATDVLPVITDVIVWLLRFAAVLSIGAIVWGGIMYIMSLGNESKAEKAKEVIKYAIIGVIVIMLSYAIIAFIQARLAMVNPFGTATAYAADGFKGELDAFEPTATKSGLSTKSDILPEILSAIQWLLALSAILAMGAIVWGGIMYIMSLGNEGRAEKAKNVILYAIIGIIVVILSYAIVNFIQDRLTAFNPFGVTPVYAQIDVSNGFNSGVDAIDTQIKPKESGLATNPDIARLIILIVNYLLGLVAVLALAAMVWGSVMYIVSLGDEGKTEKAKKIIISAVIGVLLAGVSFLILKVVQDLLTK